MTAATPLQNILKRLPTSILEKDSIPLVGALPPFPWQELAEHLSKTFQINNLTLTPNSIYEWREASELTKGFGDHCRTIGISIAPQGGMLLWILSETDLQAIMGYMLMQHWEPLPADKEIQAGFLKFLILEVLQTIPKLNFDKTLSGHIQEQPSLPTTACLCVDVNITIAEKKIFGRAVVTPELQEQLKQNYTKRVTSSPLASNIDLTVSFVAGKTALSLHEWEQLKLGDLLLLDDCSITPSGEGKVTLMVDETPIFRGKIKNGNIKILHSPPHNEVGLTMSPKDTEEGQPLDEDEEELENEIEEEEIEPEHEETETEQPEQAEEPSPIEEEEEKEEDEENYSDEAFLDENELNESEKWPPPPEKPPRHSERAQKTEEEQSVTEPPISPEEIPMTVNVEVGRIRMPVQKLMELQPGNLLNLNVHPEQGVDLVVNGKCIAKGELLIVGELLAVRILELG